MMDAVIESSEDGVQIKGEMSALVRDVARAYEYYVSYIESEYELSRSEAQEKAAQEIESASELLRKTPPSRLSEYALVSVMKSDPELAIEKWQEVKRSAREEWDSGIRSAKILGYDSPWERARFLAIRQSFVDEWQPRGGIERALIDQMAQSYTGWIFWLSDLDRLGRMEVDGRAIEREQAEVKWTGQYVPPRVGEAEYVERALRMADRFHRIFLRTLRALRDLRRYASSITIHNEGQVNIGQQQVNRVG